MNKLWPVLAICFVLMTACDSNSKGKQKPSIARQWNEVLLESISNDFARPTVHARNLFHFSAASYDAWSFLSGKGQTYLLGKAVHGFECSFDKDAFNDEKKTSKYFVGFMQDVTDDAIRESISYANYRMLAHRFAFSPGHFYIEGLANDLMEELGYDIEFVSTDYASGNPAALGNYIAQCYINFGLQDGSNEANGYASISYRPLNPDPIEPELSGNPNIVDMNHWQVIFLENAIDQAGNPISSAPPFLSPEWGRVLPFSLKEQDKTVYTRDDVGGAVGNFDYPVYFDPGEPPKMALDGFGEESDHYRWTFALVAIWSSHLSSLDNTLIDISPASVGNQNIENFPTSFAEYQNFYGLFTGGDSSQGYDLNPVTKKPYEQQMVKRGDYARVLAEYWADGPNSETPPGHWFVIFNTINDHPMLKRRIAGEGGELGRLEWDVKGYFTLGGAMHDVAITAWGIKGWYDYVRPVSAIRAMAEFGQSSNSDLTASYNPRGLPLHEGFIEVVSASDPVELKGVGDINVNEEIKIYAWRGPNYIINPDVDEAGVGWILAKDWWPYQRPTFVTPPFAGYISGHSTYSRAAAEVLTAFTGSEFFPGGMSQFEVKKNEFLVFEEGPTQDITLQWASYRDASDQCSLSRIWGGIHPPADDIPGRLIGEKIGKQAFEYGRQYFN